MQAAAARQAVLCKDSHSRWEKKAFCAGIPIRVGRRSRFLQGFSFKLKEAGVLHKDSQSSWERNAFSMGILIQVGRGSRFVQ